MKIFSTFRIAVYCSDRRRHGVLSNPLVPVPPNLVRTVVDNELAAKSAKTHRFMFRSHRETLNVNQDKLYVDTKEAMAGMVTAWNNQPLTPELRKAEEERLDRFLTDPEELRHKQKQERDDYERIERIIKAMPDAFLFEYDGTESGTATVGASRDGIGAREVSTQSGLRTAYPCGAGAHRNGRYRIG